MKKLLDNSDLGLSNQNRFSRFIYRQANKMLGIDRLNDLYSKLQDKPGVSFAIGALDELNIHSTVVNQGEGNIPEEGSFIAIVNHPHGALDGLLMIKHIISQRPDTKLMGNVILDAIQPIQDLVIGVNPLGEQSLRNISALRRAQEHINKGGGLIIFPAGEVSTYSFIHRNIQDKTWPETIIKFIHKLKAPIIPVHISGKNSWSFQFIGKLHPYLKVLRLPIELLNKKDEKDPYIVDIAIASPLSIEKQRLLPTLEIFRNYLRSNIYYMAGNFKNCKLDNTKSSTETAAQINQSPDRGLIIKEIEGIPEESMLFETEDYKSFLVSSNHINYIFKELCRLREIAYREIGEGSGQSAYLDDYDELYNHVILWDKKTNEIASAYRLCFVNEIIKQHGMEKLYSYRNYEFSPKLNELLSKSIEFSLPFIAKSHRKNIRVYTLTWKSIFIMAENHPDYTHLMGEIDVSYSNSDFAKAILISYAKERHWNQSVSDLIYPRSSTKTIDKFKLDSSLLRDIENISLIDKLVSDLERGSTARGRFFRRSIELGAQVIGFSLSKKNERKTLEALMLLDLNNISQKHIEILNKNLNTKSRD